MKKILTSVLAALLIFSTLFALISCSPTINGKFRDSVGATTFQFSGSKVIVTIENSVDGDIVLSGKYKITEKDDGTADITFDFGEDAEKAGKWQGTMSIHRGISNETNVRYILLDKYKFVEFYR